MVSVLIVYYTKSGNTKEMANMIATYLRNEKIDVEVRMFMKLLPTTYWTTMALS